MHVVSRPRSTRKSEPFLQGIVLRVELRPNQNNDGSHIVVTLDNGRKLRSFHTGRTRAFIQRHCIGEWCAFNYRQTAYGLEFGDMADITVNGQEAALIEFGVSEEDIVP